MAIDATSYYFLAQNTSLWFFGLRLIYMLKVMRLRSLLLTFGAGIEDRLYNDMNFALFQQFIHRY